MTPWSRDFPFLLFLPLLLSLFHSLPAYVFLVALMTCLMYYVPLTSTSMSTYGTCYGMILAILLVDIRLAIGWPMWPWRR